VDGPIQNSAKVTTQPKSVNFDREIMEIDIIYSNLIEKSQKTIQQSI
jgi:hypothetical protein